jgi:CheY-like chemotaxis protein
VKRKAAFCVKNETGEPRLRIALVSYDRQEMRVNATWFTEYSGVGICKGYEYGRTLLRELEQGAQYDLILLDDELRDMDAVEFTAAYSRTALLRKPPLLLLSSRGRRENQETVLQQPGNYCIIKPYRLQALTRQIELLCGMQTRSLAGYCAELYRTWGVHGLENNCAYLTEAVEIALGSPRRLAIRKEILLAVGERHGLSITAVDSAIRRVREELDTLATPAWCSFKQQYGQKEKSLSTGKLIYAMRDSALQYDIRTGPDGDSGA